MEWESIIRWELIQFYRMELGTVSSGTTGQNGFRNVNGIEESTCYYALKVAYRFLKKVSRTAIR